MIKGGCVARFSSTMSSISFAKRVEIDVSRLMPPSFSLNRLMYQVLLIIHFTCFVVDIAYKKSFQRGQSK